jgi:hypothetical protein
VGQDNIDSEASSLLDARLKDHISLLKTPEKDRWDIIAETIIEMHRRFLGTRYKRFSPAVFEMFEQDLMKITEAVAEGPKKYKDNDNILKLLRKCRRKASLACDFYRGKTYIDRDSGYKAAAQLEGYLYKLREYVVPVRDAVARSSSSELANKSN